MNVIETTGMLSDKMKTRMVDLEKEKAQLEKTLKIETVSKKNVEFTEQEIIDFLNKGKNLIKNKSTKDNKVIIDTFIEKIIVSEDNSNIDIHYNLSTLFLSDRSNVTKRNGDEGNRTPVRKAVGKDFSHHS